MKISGNLTITKENQENYKDVIEVSGYVDVQEGATFTAPVLAKSGSVYVRQGATFTAPVLAEVSGYVYVRQGATFTAPVLAEVSGYVDVQEGATFTAPVLAKSGYVYVRQGATFTAPVLAEVFKKIGYQFTDETFPKGTYLNLTIKEVDYLKRLKPLLKSNKLVMSRWHENENWKNQTYDEVIGCGTTHCVAGWIQIFEKDKYNEISAEECGIKCAPNLAHLFYKSEEDVELVIDTLIK
ncbi:hypothetical protein [Flavobacterium sp.]|uniref:hypothetical protein n=1 Tax=Flavobacterium sp. TaxID=239 RepID=UPI0026028D06|nr:hypothetical protein [Flavobacterium sp.]